MAHVPGAPSILPVLITGSAAGIVSAAALWAYSVFSPRCQFWAPVIRSLPQREAVALTFDDGPHPEFTPKILNMLVAHQTRATFFVIGRFAKAYPDIIRRIHAEGHAIGNHSFDHDHFGVNRNRAYWLAQLKDTQDAVAAITGQPPMLFRPPMGFKTRHIGAAARELHLPIIGWSVRGLDTRVTTAEQLTHRVLKQTSGHDIVMLHDGIDPHLSAAGRFSTTRQPTIDALPAMLAGIREKQLQIVPLIDALVAASADIQAGAARAKAKFASP